MSVPGGGSSYRRYSKIPYLLRIHDAYDGNGTGCGESSGQCAQKQRPREKGDHGFADVVPLAGRTSFILVRRQSRWPIPTDSQLVS